MTKYYINYTTKEAECIPNCTSYANLQMVQRGFTEVNDRIWDRYILTHY